VIGDWGNGDWQKRVIGDWENGDWFWSGKYFGVYDYFIPAFRYKSSPSLIARINFIRCGLFTSIRAS
jgi:hypothetical protein